MFLISLSIFNWHHQCLLAPQASCFFRVRSELRPWDQRLRLVSFTAVRICCLVMCPLSANLSPCSKSSFQLGRVSFLRMTKHFVPPLAWAAEEYGIKVETVWEAYTSQTCPRCCSRHSRRVLRGFRCLDCGLEAHRDAVGVLNITARCGEYAVRPMAWPMLLRWDGCGWNRNNGMPTQEKRIRVEA
jgi:putative transposase